MADCETLVYSHDSEKLFYWYFNQHFSKCEFAIPDSWQELHYFL